MPEARNSFPQPNAIRRYTQQELFRRKQNFDGSELAVPSPLVMPFVRFTSTKADPGPPKSYRFFHMGLHGLPVTETAEGLDAFGNIFEMTYGGRDVVGYAFGVDGRRTPITSTDFALTKNDNPAEGRHPVPGVTNISVKHMGANEPIQTTVSWVCYNTTQLEFLRQHFLMAGGYVVIEFGNYWSNREEQPPLLDFSDHDDALMKLTDFVIKGRQFMSDELFEPAQGNYNMVIGRVVDQSISFESDGSIHCTTVFYSTGEAVFGIHNTRLLSSMSTQERRELFSLTINDFFSEDPDSGFNLLLGDPRISELVVIQKAQNDNQLTAPEKQSYKSRFDSKFIPWSVFIRQVMARLFASVGAEDVSSDVDLFTTINFDEPEVGNHRLLASTDPSTLVIVKSFMLEGTQAQKSSLQVDELGVFAKAVPGHEPHFVSADGGEEKGLLTNGIWVNVGAIRESFVQSNTFYQGLMALLNRMNNAVENYWRLDLAFDEETQEYKIYDRKCVFGSKVSPPAYLFNEAGDGQAVGELLDFSFEANFSKESKTAILLSSGARIRQDVMEGFAGGFNQPSFWTRVLNLPDLVDELGKNVETVRSTKASNEQGSLGPTTRALFRVENLTPSDDGAKAVRIELEPQGESSAEAAERERTRRIRRFGDPMLAYIANPTKLITQISQDGARNPNQINNFVSPIPTEINMSLTITGITGVAFYDTFLVDKLPRIYSDHGVFLINEIQHDVNTNSGWTTTLGGLYYFVSLADDGPARDQPVGFTDTPQNALGTGAPLPSRAQRTIAADNTAVAPSARFGAPPVP